MVHPGRNRSGCRARLRPVAGALAATAVSGLLVAACSSPSTSAALPVPPRRSAAPAPTPTVATAPDPAGGAPMVACATGQLAASSPGDADPHRVDTTVVLRNTSSTTCVLAGYPSLQLVGTHGARVRTRTVDGGSFPYTALPASLVTLAPGGAASFHIGSSAVAGGGRACSVGSSLEVVPPSNYDHLSVAVALTACAGGTLEVSPILAGSGGAATPA